MSSLGGSRSATRGDLLELQHEQELVREGYEFLDEKRIQLAAELLRELRRYERDYAEYRALHARAVEALGGAVREHGLDDLGVYPVAASDTSDMRIDAERFLGLELAEAAAEFRGGAVPEEAVTGSPELRRCASSFRTLMERAAALGARHGNLHRLGLEYQRTDRRARALENVLLPQIATEIKAIAEQLELVEQEDAIRVRAV